MQVDGKPASYKVRKREEHFFPMRIQSLVCAMMQLIALSSVQNSGAAQTLVRVPADEDQETRTVKPPQIAVRDDQAVLLAPDGTLWAWGGLDSQLVTLFGQPVVTSVPRRLDSGRDWSQIAVGGTHMNGVKADGTLWSWEWIDPASRKRLPSGQIGKPRQMGQATNWVAVCSGVAHSIAMTDDHWLWAWGRNDRGQLGDGTRTARAEPVRIRIGERWSAIAASSFNSFALREDGTIWAWGSNIDGDESSDLVRPARIDSGTNWTAISAGAFHLLALKSDRTLWILGDNVANVLPQATAGSLLQISPDQNWVEIHSGENCYIARKSDGSWWGYWSQPRGLKVTGSPWAPHRLPFDFKPWAVATGRTSVYLGSDGSLWSWGPRLGYVDPPQNTNAVRQAANYVKSFLPDSIQVLMEPAFPIDQKPRHIWQWSQD